MTTFDALTIAGMVSAVAVTVLILTLCAFDKDCDKSGC